MVAVDAGHACDGLQGRFVETRGAADLFCGAAGFDLGRGAFGDDAASIDYQDSVREGVGLFQIVCGQENAASSRYEGSDVLA